MTLLIEIAQKLEEKYPKTDLIGVSDADLGKMLATVGEHANHDSKWLNKLKIAWTSARTSEDDITLPYD
ncbi:MAG: hypothetical protein MJ250_05295 [Alphaproteobacteria bacterium]|nr:hypothetical protein [Alphaproteobacteria bacterium]